MEHLGPGTGREKSPESIAEEIMNQSDEGVDDMVYGTEITDMEHAEPDFEEDDNVSELDFESDDGGDYSE